MIDIEVKGIPCVFNDDALNDFDMLEHLAALKQGDITELVPFAKGIFGEEQLENIKSQLRDDLGICRLTDMDEFINEAMQTAASARKADPKA